MNQPFFSIVMTVYNAELFIEEQIESVLGQTYKDWELIIIDDGSTDKSVMICDKYSSHDAIMVFHTPNQGSVRSRIYGIQKTRGVYVLVIDADDRIVAHCLERLKNTITTSGCDMVMFNYQTFSGTIAPDLFDAKKIYKKNELLYKSIICQNNSLCTKIVRGDIIRNIHPLINDRLSVRADYAITIPALCAVETACYIKEPLYQYREHASSLSHSVRPQQLFDIEKTSAAALDYIQSGKYNFRKAKSAVCIAHLKSMSWRLSELVLNQRINAAEMDIVRNGSIYKSTAPYETSRLIKGVPYIMMCCLRRRRYRLMMLFGFLYSSVYKRIVQVLSRNPL